MAKKQMGIWMDHSIAFLMELENDKITENIVEIETPAMEVDYDSGMNEKLKNSKAQQYKSNYYKKLTDSIKTHQEVVLFGPTDAKNELFNKLKSEHLLENIIVEMQLSDKMTAIQMHEFVREYFKS
jgi:hypothetical protein